MDAVDEAGEGGMVDWNSVLGKGGKVDRAEARAVGLRSVWNSSDDGEIVDRNINELLQHNYKLGTRCTAL